MKPEERIILALNTNSTNRAREWVEIFKERIKWFKIGIPLYISGGNKFVEELKKENLKVFLDLKFHDIPSVVAQSVEIASSLEVDMLTVHTLGGFEMLEQSVKIAWDFEKRYGKRPLIIGVTILTSMQEAAVEDIVGFSIPKGAEILANMAKSAGLDGIVSSPLEARKIREICGKDFIIITPGIRLPEDESFDQERVATPSFAIKEGATYIVVGRPLTHAREPIKKLERYIEDIEKGLKFD
ncbi:MAG: orotidine-5'-phosphate decarboxylase [candidate division WOR-3 bacterium]